MGNYRLNPKVLSREALSIAKEYGIEIDGSPYWGHDGAVSADQILADINDMVTIAKMYKKDNGVLDKTGGFCFYCGCELGPDFHTDHFIPKSKGGSNDESNLVPSCPPCNIRKSNLSIEEFRGRSSELGDVFYFETLYFIMSTGEHMPVDTHSVGKMSTFDRGYGNGR